jgi:hypothetical protein
MRSQFAIPIVALLIPAFFLWLASLSTLRLFFGPEVAPAWGRAKRTLLSLLSFTIGICIVATRSNDYNPDWIVIIESITGILLPILVISLTIKLYEKWINNRLSDSERLPGPPGIRAWLSGWNLLASLSILLCVWGFTQVPIWGLFAGLLAVGALLLYPILIPSATNPLPPILELTSERERVLKLLEDAKITAEEAAELLNALSATLPPPPPEITPWTPGQKLLTLGSIVVLIAFFLPWFEINLAADMQQALSQIMPPGMSSPTLATSMPRPIFIGGGDIAKGLGWFILALSLIPTIIPSLATSLPRHQRRTIMLLSLSIGSILLLYLLSGNLSHLAIGLPLVLLGYLMQFLGILKDSPRFSLSPLPSHPHLA